MRQLLRHPRHAAFVVLSLAIGIGVNVAIFAVTQGVLLRPLPYERPGDLVMVWRMPKDRPSVFTGFRDEAGLARQISTAEMFQEWQGAESAMEDLAAVELWQSSPSAQIDLTLDDKTLRLNGAQVTPNFFRLLGARAALGRTFDDDDRDVAILSDGLWRRGFGGDASVIGKTITLTLGRDRQQKSVTVIGILGKGLQFTYPVGSEIFVPLPWADLRNAPPGALRYHVMGRIRRGTSIATAQAVLDGIYTGHEDARRIPARARSRVWLEPLHEYSVGRTRYALWLLLAVTALVLVVCCGSVATLFVAHGLKRRHEVGIRLALGATRTRVAAPLIIESFIISLVAAVVAVVVVWSLIPAIASLLPGAMPRRDQVRIDAAAVGWATLCAAMTIALTSFAPAALFSGVSPATILAPKRVVISRAPSSRFRQGLIGMQVALVMLLLTLGGRLVHGFWQLSLTDLGFDGSRLVSAELRVLDPAYRDLSRLRFFQESLLARIRDVPFVMGASVTSAVPFRGVDWMRLLRKPSTGETVLANERQVERNYFELMSIPLLSGRLFNQSDDPRAPAVAVVSESLAKTLFPDGNAIGRTLDTRTPATIVGVVGNVRSLQVDQAANPAYYVPWTQAPTTLLCLLVRTDRDDRPIASAIAAAVHAVDPKQPVSSVASLDDIVASTIADRRFFAIATTSLALVTLFLAITAIWGVHTASITERTREFAIRASVGATGPHQMRTLAIAIYAPLFGGTAVGTLGAWWATLAVQRYVFGIGETTTVVFAITGGTVIILGLLSCLIPARKIAHLDVAAALRAD
ncbi:MAG: ABC transporter permease [Vicinamibacterales bacterium]